MAEGGKEKTEGKRIHSVKNQKNKPENQRSNNIKEAFGKKMENNKGNTGHSYTKSFKTLKSKALELQLSPKYKLNHSRFIKNSLGVQELTEFYKNSITNRTQQVNFPLKTSKNIEVDPFVYITSSSDEDSH